MVDPGHNNSAPRRAKRGCCILAIVATGFMAVLFCVGCVLILVFAMQMVTAETEDQLSENPILIEHIGNVESFELDWARSFSHDEDDTFIYDVKGTEGVGRVTVRQITNDDGDEEILDAELRLPNGETFDLMPDDP